MNKSKFCIILDNGHGTPPLTGGKCSPDGLYYEAEFARDVVNRTTAILRACGFNVHIVVPETRDISLNERVRRINRVCAQYGAGNCVMVSVHSNASGNGQWMKARGWSVYTTRGQNRSDKLATCIWNRANWYWDNTPARILRADRSDKDPDFESNFQIIKGANCPCCLTENFFHDNREDVGFLMSDEGRDEIAEVHARGIIDYFKSLG